MFKFNENGSPEESMISYLYRGYCYPQKQAVPTGIGYDNLVNKLHELKQNFIKNHDMDDTKSLEEICDLLEKIREMYTYSGFEYGYIVGSVLMKETQIGNMSGLENIINNHANEGKTENQN